MKPQKLFTAVAVYLLSAITITGVITLRARARARDTERKAQEIAAAERKVRSNDPEVRREGQEDLAAARARSDAGTLTDPEAKPEFTLSTNRTYGTTKNPRVWINYQGIKNLDF